MAARTKKVTFTLPVDVADTLTEYVQAHRAAGVNASALVADAVRDKLQRDRYLERLTAAFGPLDPEVLDQARASLRATAGEGAEGAEAAAAGQPVGDSSAA